MNEGIPIKILLILALGCACLSMTAGATNVKSVYTGGITTSYAVDENGSVWVWGAFQGQNYVHPTKVPFIDHVAMLASGNVDTVALKEDGTVWAWGSLSASLSSAFPGQNSTVPVSINISDVKFIAASLGTVYMVKTDGSLWMCGDTLCLGPDDITNATYFFDPVQLPINNVSRVAVADSFIYAEKDDGSWWAWGANNDYQLNDGTNVSRNTPAKIEMDNVKSVSVKAISFIMNDVYIAQDSVLALTGDRRVYGWGDNIFSVAGDSKFPRYSNAGDGSGYVVSSPNPVPRLDGIVEIGSGLSYYVALRNDGTVWAWGSNPDAGDQQSTLNSNTPVQLPGFTDIVSITVGNKHLLAVKKDGSVWAWGNNQFGQLGNGEVSTFGGKPYAVQVADLYVELPAGTSSTETSPQASSQAPGFSFSTIALIGCLFITAGLLSGFMRRDL